MVLRMYYILQGNTFHEDGHLRLVKALERLGLKYEIIDVLPFVEELQFTTTRKDVFVFGSIKLCRLAAKYPWLPGAYTMTPQHMDLCEEKYQDLMLNFVDSAILPVGELDLSNEECIFIRPVEDNKLFKGGVYTKWTWKKTLETIESPDKHLMLIASPKHIYRESRFWIVGKEIATYSSYKFGSQTNYNLPVDETEIEFCKKAIEIFKPAPAFVIDICLCDSGYKIVECGCINAAGFYSADMMKLLIALEEHRLGG
jgi:hypothetical protein